MQLRRVQCQVQDQQLCWNLGLFLQPQLHRLLQPPQRNQPNQQQLAHRHHLHQLMGQQLWWELTRQRTRTFWKRAGGLAYRYACFVSRLRPLDCALFKQSCFVHICSSSAVPLHAHNRQCTTLQKPSTAQTMSCKRHQPRLCPPHTQLPLIPYLGASFQAPYDTVPGLKRPQDPDDPPLVPPPRITIPPPPPPTLAPPTWAPPVTRPPEPHAATNSVQPQGLLGPPVLGPGSQPQETARPLVMPAASEAVHAALGIGAPSAAPAGIVAASAGSLYPPGANATMERFTTPVPPAAPPPPEALLLHPAESAVPQQPAPPEAAPTSASMNSAPPVTAAAATVSSPVPQSAPAGDAPPAGQPIIAARLPQPAPAVATGSTGPRPATPEIQVHSAAPSGSPGPAPTAPLASTVAASPQPAVSSAGPASHAGEAAATPPQPESPGFFARMFGKKPAATPTSPAQPASATQQAPPPESAPPNRSHPCTFCCCIWPATSHRACHTHTCCERTRCRSGATTHQCSYCTRRSHHHSLTSIWSGSRYTHCVRCAPTTWWHKPGCRLTSIQHRCISSWCCTRAPSTSITTCACRTWSAPGPAISPRAHTTQGGEAGLLQPHVWQEGACISHSSVRS